MGININQAKNEFAFEGVVVIVIEAGDSAVVL